MRIEHFGQLGLFFLIMLSLLGFSSLGANDYLVKGSLKTVKEGSKLKISFKLKKECDVQISIKKNGNIVRHLAAGLVGLKYSSEGLLKGLQQTIVWDGLNDYKKSISISNCTVEVGAKLQANLDKILGWDGNFLTTARGFCFGIKNNMILFSGEKLLGHRNGTFIAHFDANGEYINQIYPPPGGLKKEDREGMPTVKLSTGETVPVIHHMLSRALLPSATFDNRTNAVISKDGKSIYFLSGKGSELGISHPDVQGGRRILKLNIDGTVPKDFLGPVVIPEKEDGFLNSREGSVALSPDEKFIYVTGLHRMDKKNKWARKSTSTQVVYKISLASGSEKASVFCGVLKNSGADNTHLNNPMIVDVDGKGNVYVTDQGNHRVQIFSSVGKYIRTIKLDGVVGCKVHNKTGRIYLLSVASKKIVVYKDLISIKPVIEFPVQLKRMNSHFSIDKTSVLEVNKYGEKPMVALLSILWNQYSLILLEDVGETFKVFRDPIKKKRKLKSPLGYNRNVAVSDHWVIGQGYDAGAFLSSLPQKFNKTTGKHEGSARIDRRSIGREYLRGKDNFIYQQSGGYLKDSGTVQKYDQDLKQVPFEVGKTISGIWHGHGGASGFFVDRQGHVFTIGMNSFRNRKKNDGMGLRLREYDAKGHSVSEKRIYAQKNVYLAGVVTDSKGNIYIGARISKGKNSIPKWFEGKLPKDSEHKFPSTNYKQYASIVKFGPNGGAFIDDPQGDYYGVWVNSNRGNVKIEGGKDLGKSVMIPIRGGKDGVHCYCENTRFDIDFYDRLIVPDLHQFCIRVMDTNGKDILKIGSYGNMDNAGPKSKQPNPAIAFSWIIRSVVHQGKIYVGDANNRRISVIQLSCQEKEIKKVE